jgi:two-component system invasion response regulator UvrY
MEKITILITDDHALLRESWSFILNNDLRFKVIGECSTGEEAVEAARQLRPDVVIMDINLPGISGMEAASIIRKNSPGTRILCVSMHTQPAYARKMIQHGALGYVTKTSSSEEMIHAILEVYNNKKYICNDIKNILSNQLLSTDEQVNGFNTLSAREIDVISFIKKGLSSKEIAQELNLSVKTVEVHRYNILKKLKLKNVAAMVNYINNSQFAA